MRKTLAAVLLALSFSAPALAAPCGPIPALPDTERRTEYTGIVSQTGPFNVSFQLYGDSTDYSNWLAVWVNGVLKTAITDYTVAPASGPAFGTACLPITNAQVTFVAPQTGTIEIVGARRPRRASQVSENAGVTAHTFNQVISDLTATLRERWDRESRLLRTVPGESINPLPTLSARTLSALGFDSSGNPIPIPFTLGLGTVIGPASAVDSHVACFNGASGSIIKDCGPAVGTVSSVGLALPNIFAVTNSPVTSAGTLTGTLATQSANSVWAGPTTGVAAAPTFRALVGADLPLPSASTLGGIQSFAAVSSQWIRAISTSGVPSASQPAFTDISGTVAAAQLPNPSASTLGGVQSFAAVPNQWIKSISTSGVPASTQPAFTDISGSVAATQMPALTGDVTTSAGAVATTIANSAVTNAKAANMGAATIKCNPTASPAVAQDCTIQGLTARGSPDAVNDKVPIYDNAAGTIKFVTPSQIASSATAGVSSLNGLSGALSVGAGSGITVSAAGATVTVSAAPQPTPPQGRCTLTSGTAVTTTDVAAATTVYYTPAVGRFVPIWNGSNFIPTDMGGELSQATTDNTKSPAAVGASSNYDIFVWSDSGTMRATRGPPWSSDTSRGTGAGTTQISDLHSVGTQVNTVAITNGPAAGFGTYVCTIRSNGTSTIDMKFGTGALGGGAATLGVWNAYNRVMTRARVADTTTGWTFTSNTPHAVDASTTNRVSFVSGLQTDAISALYLDGITTAATSQSFCLIGFGMDVANAFDRNAGGATVAAVQNFIWPQASGFYGPQLGFHFIQALEAGDGTHVCSFGGDATNNTRQGLEVMMPM